MHGVPQPRTAMDAETGRDGNGSNTNNSSWLPTSVSSMLDEQRIERLDQCRILDEILLECKRSKASGQSTTLQLEDVPAGIRMVRYFDWRNLADKNCQREEHAVWACRAISLGCGADLVRLRTCFNELPHPTSILENTETAYESKTSSKSDFPCRQYQEVVGRCVASNLHDLAQRRASS